MVAEIVALALGGLAELLWLAERNHRFKRIDIQPNAQ
jgi:hypothetical protein